jgi:hypothetical protein
MAFGTQHEVQSAAAEAVAEAAAVAAMAAEAAWWAACMNGPSGGGYGHYRPPLNLESLLHQ